MKPLVEDQGRRRRVLDIVFSDNSTVRHRPLTEHIIWWRPAAGDWTH
ncbi:hypothetical protein [Mycolicibacterium conceptionense]|nr:hypothetical protein [Mycolicibacterium conceptionense]